MAVSDQFNVTATPDKPSYTTGDTVTITLSGNDVRTETLTMNVTLNIQAADGAKGTVTLAVPLTKVTPESVVITSASDDLGHVWNLDTSKLKVSTVA